MRIHWWQSIRWRLALGSMLVVMLAIVLLAFSVISAIVHYYSIDENNRLASFASDSAQPIGESYSQRFSLTSAAARSLSTVFAHRYQSAQYLLVVLNHRNHPVYSHFGLGRDTFTA